MEIINSGRSGYGHQSGFDPLTAFFLPIAKTRAGPRHEFGLRLSPEDKKAMIAYATNGPSE